MKQLKWKPYNLKAKSSKQYLIRFLTEETLKLFLEKGEIWFPRVDKFGDTLECITAQDLQGEKPNMTVLKSRQKRHLISCWHLATQEALAMWDTYGSGKDGRRKYAIRFERDELVQQIKSAEWDHSVKLAVSKLVFGRIRYKNMLRDKPTIDSKNKVLFAAFRKEYVFRYESEFRFSIQFKEPFDRSGLALKIGDLKDTSFSILINPVLDDTEYREARQKILDSPFANKLTDSRLVKWFKPHLLNA